MSLGSAWRAQAVDHLKDVRVCKLFCTAADAVEHEGQMLMVFLEDDLEDAILLWEAGCHVVKDVCQLHHELMCRVKNVSLQGKR